MDDLLPYYERELQLLRGYGTQFATRYPRVAGQLGLVSGDPHVERLLQGVALLSARVMKRIDDGYPQLTEALLESLYPHYLRPFPACAIAAFELPGEKLAELSEVRTFPRGTPLAAPAVHGTFCKFRTAADVTIAPLAIKAARFEPLIAAPGGTRLPQDATASLSISIDALSPHPLAQIAPDRLRVFVDGDPSFAAALLDALFMHVRGAFVGSAAGTWQPLRTIPLVRAGCGDDDALLPYGDRSHRAYRILTEYFCFPDKFRFFDIDLAALRTLLASGARSVTLHLALGGLRPDGTTARMLRTLQPGALRLSCTSVVNLFERAAKPIPVTHTTADYSVVADTAHPQSYEVYSVDAVRQTQKDGEPLEFTPLYARGRAGHGRHWLLRHDEQLATVSPGYEKRLSLVDLDARALDVEQATLSVDVTCTNRDLPQRLGACALGIPGATGVAARLLATATPTYRFPGRQSHWRLISHLTLNHRALTPDGLPVLRELLDLHDLPRSPVTQRLIAGIVGMESEQTTAWVKHKRGASLAHGTEVRLIVDEEAFVGSGVHLFAHVLQEFFALYAQANSYVELVLLAHRDRKELVRCKPRSGTATLA